MDRPKPKYVDLIEWIDSLPYDSKFTFKEAQMEIGICNQSVRSVVLMLVRNGRIRQTILSWKVRFYQKTRHWSKEKGIKENYLRLKAKWVKYKPSPDDKP